MSAVERLSAVATNADDAAALIERFMGITVRVDAVGRFEQTALRGNPVLLSDVAFDAEFSCAVAPRETVDVVTVRRGHYAFTVGGEEHDISGDGIAFVPPSREAQVRIANATARITSFPVAELARVVRGPVTSDEAPLDLTMTDPVSPEHAALFAGAVDVYRSRVLEAPRIAEDDLAYAELTRNLVTVTALTFGIIPARPRKASPTAAVRRAMTYVDEHLGDPVTLHDLAAAARVSPRGLQAAFKRQLDRTPTEYLRSARMASARRELLDADPTSGVTVAQVARRWGFSNTGRFARDYRMAYGENPADTLRG
jgi:AraC-like DNA-binding protein